MLLWRLGADRWFLQSGGGGTLGKWLIVDSLVCRAIVALAFPLEVVPLITFLHGAITDQEEAI